MSVSQIKKRFAEFEAYLGRDAEGLKRLKALKDAVNDLRVDLASATTKAEKQEEELETLRKRIRELNAAGEAMGTEIHRLEQLYGNMERQLKEVLAASAKADDEPEESDPDEPPTVDLEEIRRIVRLLHKRGKSCPNPIRISGEPLFDNPICDYARVILREDIATGWSHDALWEVGATVSVLASVFGVVVLESKTVMLDRPRNRDPLDFTRAWSYVFDWLGGSAARRWGTHAPGKTRPEVKPLPPPTAPVRHLVPKLGVKPRDEKLTPASRLTHAVVSIANVGTLAPVGVCVLPVESWNDADAAERIMERCYDADLVPPNDNAFGFDFLIDQATEGDLVKLNLEVGRLYTPEEMYLRGYEMTPMVLHDDRRYPAVEV